MKEEIPGSLNITAQFAIFNYRVRGMSQTFREGGEVYPGANQTSCLCGANPSSVSIWHRGPFSFFSRSDFTSAPRHHLEPRERRYIATNSLVRYRLLISVGTIRPPNCPIHWSQSEDGREIRECPQASQCSCVRSMPCKQESMYLQEPAWSLSTMRNQWSTMCC